MNLPHERRKATLKSQVLRERVRIAESRERLRRANDELRAMQGRKPAATN